jgi:glycosyltransferase involved in cell wall biosynthesis
LLVPPRDEQALAAALHRLLDNPVLRHELGKAGHRTVRERFDLQRNVRVLSDVLINQEKAVHDGQ